MKDNLKYNFLKNLNNNISILVGILVFLASFFFSNDKISTNFLIINIVYLITLAAIRFQFSNKDINTSIHIVMFYAFILFSFIYLDKLTYFLLLIQLAGLFLYINLTKINIIIAINIVVVLFDFLFFKNSINIDFLKPFIVSYIFLLYIVMYLREILNKMVLKIEELSITDDLTGLLNQKGFLAKLEDEYYRSLRYNKSFCLIMLDSDDLKRINDTYGHKYGNMVIKLIADIIKDSCRRTDFAGRYGGDEYMICLVETNIKSAYEFAERLRKTVEVKSLFTDKGKDFKVTVSIGIAGYPESGDKFYDIVENADKALYIAKSDGKNKVKYVVKN